MIVSVWCDTYILHTRWCLLYLYNYYNKGKMFFEDIEIKHRVSNKTMSETYWPTITQT